jgi:hypothetical protein
VRREPRSKIRQHREEDEVCEKGGEMTVVLRNDLGFSLNYLIILGAMEVAVNGPLIFTKNHGVS